jgi:hypothetical protein
MEAPEPPKSVESQNNAIVVYQHLFDWGRELERYIRAHPEPLTDEQLKEFCAPLVEKIKQETESKLQQKEEDVIIVMKEKQADIEKERKMLKYKAIVLDTVFVYFNGTCFWDGTIERVSERLKYFSEKIHKHGFGELLDLTFNPPMTLEIPEWKLQSHLFPIGSNKESWNSCVQSFYLPKERVWYEVFTMSQEPGTRLFDNVIAVCLEKELPLKKSITIAKDFIAPFVDIKSDHWQAAQIKAKISALSEVGKTSVQIRRRIWNTENLVGWLNSFMFENKDSIGKVEKIRWLLRELKRNPLDKPKKTSAPKRQRVGRPKKRKT